MAYICEVCGVISYNCICGFCNQDDDYEDEEDLQGEEE